MERSTYLKQIILIFWIIFIAMLFMFAISIIVVSIYGKVWAWSVGSKETFKSVIVILSLMGIPAGYAFHKKWISHLPSGLSIDEKLRQYWISFFIKIVTLEALAIIALTGYLFSADFVFLLIFGLLFLAFVLNTPNRSRVMNDLEANQESDQL